ncbi:MAG: hypothetical protein Kow0077_02120 [Anaerolineae bacterium]
MPLDMIARRLWRERRLLSVLLLAVCLVTGFFALGPLYVRAVSEAGLRYAVENTAPEQLNITLNNPEPLGPEVWELLNRELSGVVTDLYRISRSAGTVNGYVYTLGEPTTRFTPATPNDYQIVAYSNLRDIFTLVEGRWPERLAPPTAALVSGLSDEEAAENQLGDYSRGEVEAVVSVTAAREAQLEVGNRLVVGDDPSGPTAVVRIVGLVEPRIPLDDPFWEGQRLVVRGRWVPISLIEERYDFGLIVPEGAFDDWIAPTTQGNSYLWVLRTNPDVVHADTLDALEQRLNTVQNTLRARYPNMLIFSGLIDLIADFRAGLAATEGPIVLLSGAVLVLMLYHLVTTVALVLEQQSGEWAAISSRGGSVLQLIQMQALTMSLLGIIGVGVGPFVAQGILLLLERVGPLARTLEGASLGVAGLPPRAFVLSGVAALAAVVVLTLPAWPAARRSLLRLKQLVSRPPTRPAWARYFLDFVLLGLGLAFMLRLYFMVSGDVGSSLQTLLSDPASLIRLIASGVDEAGGLNDPFNLVGPALLLTGAALLWLRVFPLIMRAFGALFRRDRGLTAPLALWTVERDPGHYAQLVLLLIGTLALGTASLALDATRDVGAWSIAWHEVGAHVRVVLDPVQTPDLPDWTALPDVTGGDTLLSATTPHVAGRRDTTAIALEPERFAEAFPEWGEVVAPLAGLTAPQRPGITLPDDAVRVSVQVYARPVGESDLLTETNLNLMLRDSVGVPVEVPLETADPAAEGYFVAYEAALPAVGRSPWQLTGFRILTRRADLQDFSHEIVLDDVIAVKADGEAVVVEDFEGDTARWQFPSSRFQLADDLRVTPVTEPVAGGAGSLALRYRIRRVGNALLEPVLQVNPVAEPVIPLVVSRGFAEYQGERSAQRAAYRVGDEDLLDLTLPHGNVRFRFRVTGIVDEFPTQQRGDNFVIGWIAQLRPALNATTTPAAFYDYNQAWLELAEREPAAALTTALSAVPGVTEVLYAWDRYNALQREPLPNAITGMLFAGFWVSLALSVLDFAFYLAVTARRRAISFAVLQALGWDARHIWSVLAAEQTALVIPALVIGVLLGALLAYLMLPFLELVGGQALRFPAGSVAGLLVVLVAVFGVLLALTAIFLRRQSVHQVLRMGEE